MRAAITNGGTAIYQSSVDSKAGAGYYCYYYFWVRHNDNGNNGVMGPMEFDVVRNNVYKISVNSIARLGHPRIPANDPQRPRPQTPDESEDIYFDVTVDILPWAVRNNYIDFE
ncbi:MAG: Mfa1 fimbrilin C-terminal domain-containing protein [Muribaculaceae bacterium]|nr:Mfa1 fimbrilin C-terminal domain-containing protein [Muribaculaceae bacterium]